MNSSLSAGNYSLGAQVTVEGDLNRANDVFETPFVVESTGEPGDLGVEITDVSPLQISRVVCSPSDTSCSISAATRGDAQITFQLATSSGGSLLLTETVTVGGPETDIVRESPRRKTWPLARTVQSCA
ncbi:MAG: hypothetical protein R2724_27605 [Bryobacterales bacterium]